MSVQEALNAGSVDIGSVGGVDGAPLPLFAQAAGADPVSVAAEPPRVTGKAIIVKGEPPIRNVAQLGGRKIAFQRGSGSHLLLVAALEKAGMGIRDARRSTWRRPRRATFESSAIDAWVVWDPYLATAQKAYRPRVLADRTGLLPAYGFYVASRRFVQPLSDVLSIVLDEFARAGQWANTRQTEMVAMMGPRPA